MNMAISSSPISTGKVAASTSGSAAGSATGSGFAGALVQAIDGTSNTATVSNGLSLPVGLAGLLGQLGLDASAEQSQDLLEMLAGLVEQLEQLEQSDLSSLTSDVQSQLAELLAAFQSLLQQIGQNQSAQADPLTTTDPVSVDSKPIVRSLRETLQQLAAVIASSDENVPLATNFAGQLKALLDSITAKTQSNQAVSQGAAQEDSAEGVQTATPNKAAVDSVSATKDAVTQTAVVVQERRSVQALRDPVWRFNVTEVAENEASNSQPAVVTSAAASGEASQSGSQPAWTFLQNDVTTNAELQTGKPSLRHKFRYSSLHRRWRSS
ncbi:hypothetical protein [Cohnella cholangitidis]|uniref:Uncharacterized protein n=1 Tax=Cohnella cholangitidis TaxID=2598458 RepID=A0A7G5BT84_9BACL|nr:hypothetical protein [Cohnella cholangitidis]QMV40168.1 hypothetical protein FPL14_02340 [Cohnella cholangitidis]